MSAALLSLVLRWPGCSTLRGTVWPTGTRSSPRWSTTRRLDSDLADRRLRRRATHRGRGRTRIPGNHLRAAAPAHRLPTHTSRGLRDRPLGMGTSARTAPRPGHHLPGPQRSAPVNRPRDTEKAGGQSVDQPARLNLAVLELPAVLDSHGPCAVVIADEVLRVAVDLCQQVVARERVLHVDGRGSHSRRARLDPCARRWGLLPCEGRKATSRLAEPPPRAGVSCFYGQVRARPLGGVTAGPIRSHIASLARRARGSDSVMVVSLL